MSKENKIMCSFRLDIATKSMLAKLSDDGSIGQGQLIDELVHFAYYFKEDYKRWITKYNQNEIDILIVAAVNSLFKEIN